MADPTAHLPQTNEALEAEIQRVEAQLKALKHQRPSEKASDKKQQTKSSKRKVDNDDSNTVYSRPTKQSAPYLSQAHLDGDFSDIANMTAQQLAAEIAAVEHDLREEYTKAYATMFTDEASVKAEMKRLQDEIARHLGTIDSITQPSTKASLKSKSSSKRKRQQAESDTSRDSCICQLAITSSDVPLTCDECKLRYHASCFSHLFTASGVAEPHHRVDAFALYFLCPNHSVGSPLVRLKTQTEIEADVSQIKSKRSIAEQLIEMEERLAQIKALQAVKNQSQKQAAVKNQSRYIANISTNQSINQSTNAQWTDDESAADEESMTPRSDNDDGSHSDPHLVERVRNLMKVMKYSQSDVVRQSHLSGGASAFSCWLNDRPIPQREKKEATIRQWCDALEAQLAME